MCFEMNYHIINVADSSFFVINVTSSINMDAVVGRENAENEFYCFACILPGFGQCSFVEFPGLCNFKWFILFMLFFTM